MKVTAIALLLPIFSVTVLLEAPTALLLADTSVVASTTDAPPDGGGTFSDLYYPTLNNSGQAFVSSRAFR